ncbi:MAG: endo alpha-1,4 polygalactosaminidase [Pseudomonadota bacterium]
MSNRTVPLAAAFTCAMAAFSAPLPVSGDVKASGAYWDWQLDSPVDYSVDVDVLVMDLMETTTQDISDLKARGVKTVCYVSIGAAENYRDDYEQFPPHVLGADYYGWPDEKFIDIRALDVVLPIMQARIDECAARGFDAIEPDNMDTWDNETGFPLTQADQIAYVVAIAEYTRAKGLEIAHKNAPTLIEPLHQLFDFAIVESCFQYDFCDMYGPYLAAGKDVLAAEYPETGIDMSAVCAFAESTEIKFIFKARELASGFLTC